MRMLCTIALGLLASPVLAQEAPSMIGTALNTGNIEASLRLYTDGLGMVIGHEMPQAQGREFILSFSKTRMQPGIMMLSDAKAGKTAQIKQGNGLSHIVLRAPNIELLAAQLKNSGYAPTPICGAAMGCRMMMVTDPDDYRYELVESRGAKKENTHDGK